ncbi:MAG: endonuclease III [bacterium]
MESLRKKKTCLAKITKILALEYPEADIALEFGNPFQLLVATILSAQCTDKRVNMVTERLFKKYKTPKDFVKIKREELEKMIFSTGYYKAKAKKIKDSSKVLIDKFNGQVPDTMDELLSLPGVGRKTANVILGHCFKAEGIVVDTHVIRLSNKLGLVETNNAGKIEKSLNEMVPEKEWRIFTHYIINHGRKVCIARRPKCDICIISQLCPSAVVDER